MSDQHLYEAEAIIRAADAGAYDEQFGIDRSTRALLTKLDGDAPVTLADISELKRINRPDLIDEAHRAGRINLNPNGA